MWKWKIQNTKRLLACKLEETFLVGVLRARNNSSSTPRKRAVDISSLCLVHRGHLFNRWLRLMHYRCNKPCIKAYTIQTQSKEIDAYDQLRKRHLGYVALKSRPGNCCTPTLVEQYRRRIIGGVVPN